MSTADLPVQEIISEYRQSKNKQKQITILGDLHAVPPREIAQLLQDAGEVLPSYWAKALAHQAIAASAIRSPEPPEVPDPSTAITVGKLIELVSGLPPDAPVLLEDKPLRCVCFSRSYNAEDDSMTQYVMLLE